MVVLETVFLCVGRNRRVLLFPADVWSYCRNNFYGFRLSGRNCNRYMPPLQSPRKRTFIFCMPCGFPLRNNGVLHGRFRQIHFSYLHRDEIETDLHRRRNKYRQRKQTRYLSIKKTGNRLFFILSVYKKFSAFIFCIYRTNRNKLPICFLSTNLYTRRKEYLLFHRFRLRAENLLSHRIFRKQNGRAE